MPEADWKDLPNTPSLLTLDMKTSHYSIQRALLIPARIPPWDNGTHLGHNPPFPVPKAEDNGPANLKRKAHRINEPLRRSDAPGGKAAIHLILGRCHPRCILYHKRSPWVEEILFNEYRNGAFFKRRSNNKGLDMKLYLSLV